jgi:hypothetical protein
VTRYGSVVDRGVVWCTYWYRSLQETKDLPACIYAVLYVLPWRGRGSQ